MARLFALGRLFGQPIRCGQRFQLVHLVWRQGVMSRVTHEVLNQCLLNLAAQVSGVAEGLPGDSCIVNEDLSAIRSEAAEM